MGNTIASMLVSMLVILIVLIIAGFGMIVGDSIEFYDIHDSCLDHGFDGGGLDYKNKEGDLPVPICWRYDRDNGEVYTLDWTLAHCNGIGVCLEDNDGR